MTILEQHISGIRGHMKRRGLIKTSVSRADDYTFSPAQRKEIEYKFSALKPYLQGRAMNREAHVGSAEPGGAPLQNSRRPSEESAGWSAWRLLSPGLWAAGVFLLSVAPLLSQDRVSFSRDILPVFEQRCQKCHGASAGQANLSLASHQAILKGGSSGPAVMPGDSKASLLIKRIGGDKPEMPLLGEPLESIEVSLISRWIDEGALDDTPQGKGEGSQSWWSLRPLQRPDVPAGDSSLPDTPLDRFVAAKHEEEGLVASPEARRQILIRRLTYSLHGLPPTPQEVGSFVEDTSPKAYRSLVDRLLDSPRYGERWGRHWLDVVHYGESHGYDKDKARRNSWPYRDYVIRSFNEDKPFTRFVQEQLAGDYLWPDDPNALIATGFIAAGPWDHVGHAELREGTKDKKLARLLDRDDMVAATMSTFASLTVHCARCHDHKFDPILQEDYYSLQAVFAGVDRAEQPYDRDPATYKQRRELWFQLRDVEFALQPFLEGLKETTSHEIEGVERLSKELEEEDTRLKPNVGEVDTPETIRRRDEIAKRIKELSQQRDQLARALMDPESRAKLAEIESRRDRLQAVFDALPKPEYVYSAASYFKSQGKFAPAWEPRPVHLLERGNVESPGPKSIPGAVSAVRNLPARFAVDPAAGEGARRAALAKWIVDPDNPLTWRSIVNRVWHYHFGRGLVDSPNDFGRMGGKPTHPELLDWLAAKFRDSGGSFKELHRLILNSATYRQSSAHNAANARVDGSNQYLWRMNRLRLDAEAVRDTVLSVSGRLDLTMGGPSVEQFFFKDDHSPVYDYARFDFSSPQARRRSVYRFLVRSVQDPFMESLDCADPSLLVPKRNSTLTAIQALALLNDPLMVQESRYFAERLRAKSSDLAEQIDYGIRLALGRQAIEEEVRALSAHADRHGLENAVRLIYNSNEFIFVD